MSGSLLDRRGQVHALGAEVVACGFSGATAGFALGDGTVRLHRLGAEDGITARAHEGAVLCLAPVPGGFVTGGDDGRLVRTGTDGAVTELASFGGKWVGAVATFREPRRALIAAACGKRLHLFGDAVPLKVLEHPSTVTGVVFDAKGKRLAASHYNGASLWFVAAREDRPRLLEWKGSHIGIVMHPAGEAVVTAMQENALHGWWLANGEHMRMSGYPVKTRSMAFTRNGKWLGTSGADALVLWPFTGGGPMGREPIEVGEGRGALCTRVAARPNDPSLAAAFSDGSVLLVDPGIDFTLRVAQAGDSGVTALAWNEAGTALAFGTEDGSAALVNLGPEE